MSNEARPPSVKTQLNSTNYQDRTMIKILLTALLGCICLAGNLRASPITIDWKANGGVDSVFAGAASISFTPIYVQSFESISISGYWTNLVDTRYSNLQAEIRVRSNGNWQTVAYNDHVRGAYGTVSDFVSSDFVILPNDLSSAPIDGLMIAPNSVIYSGLGGLNSGSGTAFSLSPLSVPEPQSAMLAILSLGMLGAVSRCRRTNNL